MGNKQQAGSSAGYYKRLYKREKRLRSYLLWIAAIPMCMIIALGFVAFSLGGLTSLRVAQAQVAASANQTPTVVETVVVTVEGGGIRVETPAPWPTAKPPSSGQPTSIPGPENPSPQQLPPASTAPDDGRVWWGEGTLLSMDELQSADITAFCKSRMREVNPKTGITYYDQIVRDANAAGWNPAYIFAIWVEESDCSNYGAYPSVADFGVKNDVQTSAKVQPAPLANFDWQIQGLLYRKTYYRTNPDPDFAACRNSDGNPEVSAREYSLLYSEGAKGCKSASYSENPQFPGRIVRYFGIVTGGGKLEIH